jgi:hypothetical protein
MMPDARFDTLCKQWAERATKEFKGKKVALVRWMTKAEMKEMGWFHSAPVIIFEDGSNIIAQSDDEGNDAGALSTSSEVIPIMPVI